MYYNNRYLMYEKNNQEAGKEYGSVSSIISDKLINVDLGGTSYILEGVRVDGSYIPKVGEWVIIEWSNGYPIAKTNGGTPTGLTNINDSVKVISQNEVASGVINSEHIRTNTIEARHIQANSVQAQHISANSIDSTKIVAGSLTALQLSANSIISDVIATGAITTRTIQAGAITSNLISANSIMATHIQSNAILSNMISANQIQSQHISANSIASSMLQTDSVQANNILAGSITSAKISSNAIQSQHISANVVQSQHIISNSIMSYHVSANQIQTIHISANSIDTSKIIAGSITSSLLSANSIQSQHISSNSIMSYMVQSNAIQSQHISANSIDTSKIIAGSITSSLISANSIQTIHISANSIDSTKIIAGSITSNLLSANSIQSIHISSNVITSAMIQSNAIQSQHISANSITSSMIQAGAVLASSVGANQINAVHISANSIQSQHISANSIQSQHISSNAIQSQHISANSINSGHIIANAIQSQHISANSITSIMVQSNAIQSQHISANSINVDHLTVDAKQRGLIGQYYTYTGSPVNKFQTYKGSQIDSTINFNWVSGSPVIIGQNDYFAIRWQGYLYAPETGTYTFGLTADDGGKIIVNNTTIVNQTAFMNMVEQTGTISLVQGAYYPILIEMFEGSGNSACTVTWTKPSAVKEVLPSKYLNPGNTVIDGTTILTGTITASSMQVGTITASSGIIADGTIQTAHIGTGVITSVKIGNGEIKTVNIASGNITNALIADATITYAKIQSVDAGTISTGFLSAQRISSSSITGDKIAGNSISGNHIAANQIDSIHIKAGAITSTEISAHSITSREIASGAITSDAIRAGSITAQHISTIGLDAQVVQVYNSQTGETLIGSGYLRVDGLDVGVIQSDNLVGNGLFLASSSDFGFARSNPSGIAILGNNAQVVGGHQIWKIDLTTGQKVKAIDIPAKQPVDISIHPSGNFAYVTVQGDDSLLQIDLSVDAIAQKLQMQKGPSRVKWVGDALSDHKHFFVLNTDPSDKNIPDSVAVIDTPPNSVNGDLYLHHNIVLGNNPYDFVLDANDHLFITMASQGDIVMVDASSHDSHTWKVKGRLPISAYGTDNYHGGLTGTYGLQEVTGGDSASQYDSNSQGSMSMSMGGMSHTDGGYGHSDGTLRKYEPHGIALSSDPDTLYVLDNANGELVVIDKYGNAPYNALTGRDNSSQSPALSRTSSSTSGGGPRTTYVRYRIPVGNSPEFIEVVNGKIFITLKGDGAIAIINESDIINQINADRTYYIGWNVTMPMRVPTLPTPRMIMNIGVKPTYIKAVGNILYVTLSGQNQIAIIDSIAETVTNKMNTGANPKGFAITPDNKYMYIANYGGTGDLAFVYPSGNYIGDPYIGLEGGIVYQGAHRWVPNRSDWVYDASGNILANSSVEFRINEPFLNEGGYTKLTTLGSQFQFAKIEQDITEVVNYSNGNNTINVVAEKLGTVGTGNAIFYPKNQWISGTVTNINICSMDSGGVITKTLANSSIYTLFYDVTPSIQFSANTVVYPNWVEADYTALNDINFKSHNGSILVAIENGSSPNFNTVYEIDEFVPKFVVVDNQQTSQFTPTSDGINQIYNGLQYSTMTNRALSMSVTSSATPTSGNISLITNGFEIDELYGDTTANPVSSSNQVILPSGNQYVTVDLGAKYMIGQISVSHMYGADRVYHNTKTQVSEDGVAWTTVFDSAVSGEYNEKPYYHALHNHTHYAHFITFNALPVRYIRDYANGWKSGDGLTSGNENAWTEIRAYGDWKLEESYVYPSNSVKAGTQIATNGKGFVSTDITNATIAMDIPIEFTTWWYMTYIVGPEFGTIAIDMPTVMSQSHVLSQESTYYNNVAHRHLMSLPPSVNLLADPMKGNQVGMHRIVLRQVSGKVTVDRLRFEDFQYYNRSSLLIPTNTASTIFTRYKQVAEQAKWYQGIGRQSTEGAYDTVRVNNLGQPDKSVPIKYRVRFRAQLNPSGNTQERGIAYVTSAIFETGKQHTHWRRSEAVDIFPANRLETWDSNQPSKTGIQTSHLANGSVIGSKIMPLAIMDHHISNYARISEHKLDLNYPTHRHGKMVTYIGQGPMGTDLNVWIDNSTVLNSIDSWAGISGNYGTGNTISRGDHLHDDRYLQLSGGTISGNIVSKAISTSLESHFANGIFTDPASSVSYGLKVSQGIATDNLYVNGNVSISGNITNSGTINGVSITSLNTTVTGHIGSGGNAHALVVSGGANGFMSGTDKAKLDGIQLSAINQTTTDGLYVQLAGSTMIGTLNLNPASNLSLTVQVPDASSKTIRFQSPTKEHISYTRDASLGKALEIFREPINGYTSKQLLLVDVSGNTTIQGDATVSGMINGVNITTLNSTVNNHIGSGGSAHALVISNGANGFMSGADKAKLDGIQTNSINQITADGRYYIKNNQIYVSSDNAIVGVDTGNVRLALYKKSGQIPVMAISSGGSFMVQEMATGDLSVGVSGTVVLNTLLTVNSSSISYMGSTIWNASNFNPATKSDTTHTHPDATEATDGFMSIADKIKIDGIQPSANNYIHPSGTGFIHLPSGGSSGNFIKWLSDGTGSWANVSWGDVISKPTTFTPSAHTHVVSDITDLFTNVYSQSSINSMLAGSTYIKSSQANLFTSSNTYTNAGMAIKIQPSANVANSTKLMQINNTSGNELFSVNYSGGVSVLGDLTVTGVQVFNGTTNVNGNYTVSGTFVASGNSTFGSSSNNLTIINGDAKVFGQLKQINNYIEVHRRPLYGIAGDLQFQTDSISFEDIVLNYAPTSYGLPSPMTGATRYYRIYCIYSDDINSTQVSAGQKATLRLSGDTTKDFDLIYTWGDPNNRRDWYSPYFTDLPTNHITLQAKLMQSGNNLGIRWIELIAYDRFES